MYLLFLSGNSLNIIQSMSTLISQPPFPYHTHIQTYKKIFKKYVKNTKKKKIKNKKNKKTERNKIVELASCCLFPTQITWQSSAPGIGLLLLPPPSLSLSCFLSLQPPPAPLYADEIECARLSGDNTFQDSVISGHLITAPLAWCLLSLTRCALGLSVCLSVHVLLVCLSQRQALVSLSLYDMP